MLGPDNQDADYIRRLVDFLLEIEIDMAEFSILTPFPHTPVTSTYEKEGRILHRDWSRYTTAEVVYRPKKMSPETLQEMYAYAWKTFYADMPQSLRMSQLFAKVVRREMEDGTYRPARLGEGRRWRERA